MGRIIQVFDAIGYRNNPLMSCPDSTLNEKGGRKAGLEIAS